ncbi:MAG: hypothetical protein IAE78_07645 [Myxococcus sp.]|nr:hypothetical protein [Myxococcus sp.]
MSADVDIDRWLTTQGFGAEGRGRARAELERHELTRPGKARLSLEKLDRATAVLGARFVLHCHAADCIAWARATGRAPLTTDVKQACQRCGGSENARAAQALTEAGIRKLVVVGGTPATREELERLLGGKVELRLVDGTRHRPIDRAKADLEWADRVLLWGATELHHKVSKQYADAPNAKHRVVHVPRRGVAQLLAGAVESVTRAAR